MKPLNSKLILSLSFFVVISLIGCGKVTQVTKKEEVNKAFKLTFTLQSVPTANQNAGISSTTPGGIFTVLDTPLYAQLSGISEDGKKDELAWGKAELIGLTEVPPQTENEKARNIQPKPETKYFSTAFRKDGVKLTKENYQWGYLTFNNSNRTWQGDFAQVPQNYPIYLLVVYSETGKYAMKFFSDADISKKADISFTNLNAYDTFLTGLFLVDLQESKTGLKETSSYNDLTKLFSTEVFNALSYIPLPNSVKQFRPKSPVFIFKRELETSLLDLMSLTQTQDLTEVDILLTKLKRKKMLPDKAATLLKKNAEFFRKETTE